MSLKFPGNTRFYGHTFKFEEIIFFLLLMFVCSVVLHMQI